MSNDDKNKKHRNLREEILDQFPEDMLPGFKPEEIDPLNNSFAEIVKATGIKTVLDKMVTDPAQKHAVGVFLDALIEKQSPHFESMRESLKDDSIRRKILLEMAKATGKNVK